LEVSGFGDSDFCVFVFFGEFRDHRASAGF
jgi:hypothetical protein